MCIRVATYQHQSKPYTIRLIQETLLGLHLTQLAWVCEGVEPSLLRTLKLKSKTHEIHTQELKPQHLIWISPYSDYSNKLDASCVCSRELNTEDIPTDLLFLVSYNGKV